MSDILNTAELIEIKKEVLAIEKQIERLMRLFERKEKINFERPNDYGQRFFIITIYFDEMNLSAFDNTEEIRNLYRRYYELRKHQLSIEKIYDVEKKIQLDIKIRELSGNVY